MDLFPCSREFEAIRHKAFFSEDFEGSISFSSQLFAGSHRGDVGSFQPNFISFLVITSIHSFLVIKCLHHLDRFGQRGLCFSSSLREVVDEVLGHLAFDFVMGFESLVWVSSMVEEEW